MTYLPNQTQQTGPNINDDVLRAYLVNVHKQELRLRSVTRTHVLFETSMSYSITNRTKAKYKVVACIPIDNPFFQGEERSFILPSTAAPYIRFIFDTYSDNRGVGQSWID